MTSFYSKCFLHTIFLEPKYVFIPNEKPLFVLSHIELSFLYVQIKRIEMPSFVSNRNVFCLCLCMSNFNVFAPFKNLLYVRKELYISCLYSKRYSSRLCIPCHARLYSNKVIQNEMCLFVF